MDTHEPSITKQMTLADFDRMFPDETACRLYLTMRRWPSGPTCPRCGNTKVYEGSGKRAFTWQCMKCGGKRKPYRFSVTVGTVFENSNYKLLVWFKVLYLILTSKKGISALQIHRMIGSGSYRTAWFMCHRLRAGLADDGFKKLMGIVEVDETYIGGENANRHWDKRKEMKGRGSVGKTAVIGAIARKGNLVCRVLDDTTANTLTKFVRDVTSSTVRLIATDTAGGYHRLTKAGFKHETVDHKAGEYVRGVVHTQNLDSFWSLLKRGVMGTFHNVSAKYLPLYLNEFQFRYNNRKEQDIFGKAIAGC
jgi:transposase-like protein/predicted RNA-binding Zn-ribbon protein involved in translation (DUF1610 family)